MPPESLTCKECGTEYPLEALYVCDRCFGPLEVAYGPRSQTDPDELRRRIRELEATVSNERGADG